MGKKRTPTNNPNSTATDPGLDSLLEALRQPDPESQALFEALRRQPHNPQDCALCWLLSRGADG